MNKLILKDVSISVGKKIICHNLSMQFAAGEIWGVLGANGSGKTTFLHTLGGLHHVSTGEVFLNDVGLPLLPRKQIAKHIGLLFQDTQFHYPQTVAQYCEASRYPHRRYFDRLHTYDHEVIAAQLELLSLATLHKQNILHLSGGEKRRLNLAAVLTQQPDIYLLDEPTNHLDICYQMQVLKHFQSLSQQQKTIVMSLHDLNLVQRFCTHVLFLFPNAEVLHGKSSEILNTNMVSRLYNHPMQQVSHDNRVYWQAT